MINICLHRIHDNAKDPYALPAGKVLVLLHILQKLRCTVNITFDDGYYDSLVFARQHAASFPQFGWFFFFSPALAVEGGNYPWDTTPQRMATRQELLDLARETPVLLGNHTNKHLRQCGLPETAWQAEYRQSIALYEEHFGPCMRLAFPYGTPGVDFDENAIKFLQIHYPDMQLWSTEARIQRSPELAVRPRIVVRNDSWPRILARFAYYALCKKPV